MEAGLQLLASSVGGMLPGTQVLTASPGTDSCPQGAVSVVHMVVPERVLFETASDQPAEAADRVLDFVAQSIRRDAPTAQVTVLGHTDAIGSDAYNIALSRRRAETVLRALVARKLQPEQLSIVAIGKRQPIADNDTPEGRAQNRRVEFLVSPCLAANLEIITRASGGRAPVPAGDGSVALNSPLQVLRLEPAEAGSFALQAVAAVALNKVATDVGTGSVGPRPLPDVAATQRVQKPAQPSRLLPAGGSARASPSPAYQPRTLAPDAEPRSLGPAISY